MWVLNNEGEDMIYWSPDNLQKKHLILDQYSHFYVQKIIPVMAEMGVEIS